MGPYCIRFIFLQYNMQALVIYIQFILIIVPLYRLMKIKVMQKSFKFVVVSCDAIKFTLILNSICRTHDNGYNFGWRNLKKKKTNQSLVHWTTNWTTHIRIELMSSSLYRRITFNTPSVFKISVSCITDMQLNSEHTFQFSAWL